jgi:exocyst complex component 4
LKYFLPLCSEEFKETPERLEVLLREKHFLTASRMLLDAIKTLGKKEMVGIGALSDLRRYLKAQQSVINCNMMVLRNI